MFIRQLLKSISWRYKLLLVVLPPGLVAVSTVVLAAYTIIQQSEILSEQLAESKERQRQATDSLVSVLQLQSDLQGLIAASSAEDLRAMAITTIRASSALDESIQRMEAGLNNEKVQNLKSALAEIRPVQMKVIGLARKNADEDAVNTVKDMAKQTAAILDTARSILIDEQDSLQLVADNNRVDGKSVITTIALWTGAGLTLSLLLAFILLKLLLNSLDKIRTNMKRFASGELSIGELDTGRDELGVTASAIKNAIEETSKFVGEVIRQSASLKESAHCVFESSHQSSEQSQ